MKIGDTVKIRKCNTMYVNLTGQSADVIDLDLRGESKNTIYPVWVKVLSGSQKGKTYGFQYDELEVCEEDKQAGQKTVVKEAEELLEGIATGEEKRGEKALRIGGWVKIRKCDSMPEVLGQNAEVVDLQTQQYDKYSVYPVWVKMVSGVRKGRIYGFNYDELEVLPRAHVDRLKEAEIVDHVEKMLGAIKSGGMIKIKNCDSLRGVVGESAEIVEMQVQEYDEYGIYPLWARMISGEKKGKVYGFKYDEVEIMPPELAAAPVEGGIAEQLNEILKGTATLDDIVDIERAIEEVKGNILLEKAGGFWENKAPCWEMLRCPEAIRNECPAFKHKGIPCWQMEGTYCKLHGGGNKGQNTDMCRVCRVYKRWGGEEPIKIEFHGRGFNTASK